MRFRYSLWFALALSACETPYDGGLFYGVTATQVDAVTLRVSARGNDVTSNATIQNYVLMKAAEETLIRGFDVFEIVDGVDTTRVGAISSGTATAFGGYNSATAFGTAFSTPVVRPGQDALVRMHRGQKPADAPPNVFDAREVVQYLGPAIGRSSPPSLPRTAAPPHATDLQADRAGGAFPPLSSSGQR